MPQSAGPGGDQHSGATFSFVCTPLWKNVSALPPQKPDVIERLEPDGAIPVLCFPENGWAPP